MACLRSYVSYCYHRRYSSISFSMPVREIEEFVGPEASQANAMDNDEVLEEGGGTIPPQDSRRAIRRGFRTFR